jgi:hypothetical protein
LGGERRIHEISLSKIFSPPKNRRIAAADSILCAPPIFSGCESPEKTRQNPMWLSGGGCCIRQVRLRRKKLLHLLHRIRGESLSGLSSSLSSEIRGCLQY